MPAAIGLNKVVSTQASESYTLTFLITEVGPYGTAVVAESAALSQEAKPFTTGVASNLTYGAKKIVAIPRLHCAVGIWGSACVVTKEKRSHSTDVWVADFLESRQDLKTIRDCADALKDQLLATLEYPNDALGFQLAGGPPDSPQQFCEVTNANPTGTIEQWRVWDYAQIHPSWGCQPQPGVLRLARGLGYGTGFIADVEPILPNLISYKPDLAPLKASLQGRAGFLAACVRFACEIERATAGDHLNVGGGISIVTVSLDGEISYTPPLNGFS